MSKTIGIIGAMDIEVNGIVSSMENITQKTISIQAKALYTDVRSALFTAAKRWKQPN